jgi:uncharacterized membrane protein
MTQSVTELEESKSERKRRAKKCLETSLHLLPALLLVLMLVSTVSALFFLALRLRVFVYDDAPFVQWPH